MSYRVYIAEREGSRAQLALHGWHYHSVADTLEEAWYKFGRVLMGKSVNGYTVKSIPLDNEAVGKEPERIGNVTVGGKRYPLYVHEV